MNRRTFLGGFLAALLGGALRQRSNAQSTATSNLNKHQLLIAAINGKRLIRFSYKGHQRVVQPHLYGRTSTGESAISGYQVDGGSESGDKPSWRLFLTSTMEELALLAPTFTPRSDFTANAKTPWREVFATVAASEPPPT